MLQREITKENCIKCITASSQMARVIIRLKFTYLGVIQQCMYETIRDVEDMQKRLMQTWFAFDQVIIDATTDSGVTV